MRRRIEIVGAGRARIAAFGFTDAEARLEKEARAIDPGVRLEIRALHRSEHPDRIVEEFEAEYRLRFQVEVEDEGSAAAELRSEAFRRGRSVLEGTRFARIAWEHATFVRGPEAKPGAAHPEEAAEGSGSDPA